jgi:dolichol-phosphate mannosyltransferase/undecaprenyl-phosphate 4-deoxy-4-formamido-L-arabinose transferase
MALLWSRIMASEPNVTSTELDVDFSVVVSVYNSERTLEALVERVGKVFHDLGRTYEIVLTDDGSRDGSWRVIEALHARGEPIRAFRLMRNHGQHYALKCGLDNCTGRYAITMDDDLQHPPEEIVKLIEAIESDPEVDVVIGDYEKKEHSAVRNAGTSLHNYLNSIIFGKDPKLALTSFRIINRSVLNEIRKVGHVRPRIGLIILSITRRIKNVPVRHEPRKIGRSGYSWSRMIVDTWDNVINYSALPLRIVSWIGISSSVLSGALAVFYLIRRLLGEISVSGFTSTILVVLFSSGLILFSFGFVGEYLNRIMSQQMMAAQYTVRTTLLPTHEEHAE